MDFFGKPPNLENAATTPPIHPAHEIFVSNLSAEKTCSPCSNSTLKLKEEWSVIYKDEVGESHCKEMNNEVKKDFRNEDSGDEAPPKRVKGERTSTMNSVSTNDALPEDAIVSDLEGAMREHTLTKAELVAGCGAPCQNSSSVNDGFETSILRAVLLQNKASGMQPSTSKLSPSRFIKTEMSSSTSCTVHASSHNLSPTANETEVSSRETKLKYSLTLSPSLANQTVSDPQDACSQSESFTQSDVKPSDQLGRVKRTLTPRTSSLPILTIPKVRLSRDHAGESSSSWSHVSADSSTSNAADLLGNEGQEGSSRALGEANLEGGDSAVAYSAAGTSGSGEESTSAESVSARPSLLQMALEHGSSQVNSEETRHQVTTPATVRVCPILPINPKNTGEVKHRHYKTKEKRYYQCQFCDIIYEQVKKLDRHMKDPQGKAPYQCCYCEQTFPTQGCRRFHSRLHEDKSLPCPFCEKVFNEKRRYEDHVRSHTGEAPFMCQECGNVYRTRSALRIHKRTHGSDKPLQCRFCPKRFIRIGDVQVHERTHTGEKPYKCGICPSSFATSSQVNRHRRTHSEDRPHECAYCNKTFKNPDYLITHEKMHLGHKPHRCKFCPKTFRTPRELVHHERVHTGEKPYACKECGHRFSKKTNLKQHELQHTGVKSFKCSHCPKSFFRKSSMTWHEKIHENQERFTCKECGKLFFKESSRDKHFKTVHCENNVKDAPPGEEDGADEKYVAVEVKEMSSDTPGLDESTEKLEEAQPKEKVIKKSPAKSQAKDGTDTTCEECGKTFLARKSLLRHLRAIHNKYVSKNGEGESPKGKKGFSCRHCSEIFQSDHLRHVHEASHTNEIFTCDTCKKVFATRQLLSKHEKIHSGVKPHVCETCGSAFTIKWYLNRHINIVHSDVYNYTCDICQKQFKAKAALTVHMQLHNVEGTNYKCDLCAAVFQVKRYLARHKRRYHHEGSGGRGGGGGGRRGGRGGLGVLGKGKGKSKKKVEEEDPLSDFEDNLEDDFDIMKEDSQSVSGVFLRQMLSSGSDLDKVDRDSSLQNHRNVKDRKMKNQRNYNYSAMHDSEKEGISIEQDEDTVERQAIIATSSKAFGEDQAGEGKKSVDVTYKTGSHSEPNYPAFLDRDILDGDESAMFPSDEGNNEYDEEEGIDEELFSDKFGLEDRDDKDDDYVADEDTMSDFDEM